MICELWRPGIAGDSRQSRLFDADEDQNKMSQITFVLDWSLLPERLVDLLAPLAQLTFLSQLKLKQLKCYFNLAFVDTKNN